MVKALVVALTLGTALTAHAAEPSTYDGSCGYDTNEDPTRPDVQAGLISSEVVVYSLSGAPVSATVTCTVLWKGEPVASASFEGTTVVAGTKYVEYVDTGEGYDSYCFTIDYTSDDTPTESYCFQVDTIQFPPQEVYDVLEKIRS